MILIGIGSNLSGDRFPNPRAACEAALGALERRGIRIRARSPWFRSAPVPPSDQPWFVNGVAAVETQLDPGELLALLHEIEAEFGRVRTVRNAARVIDLDLLAYDGIVQAPPDGPVLPHPRLHERAFVLLPLATVAPDWHHPVLDKPLAELIVRLPAGQPVEPVTEREGGATP